MKVQKLEAGQIGQFKWDGAYMAVFSKDERLQRRAQTAQKRRDGLGDAGEAAVEEEGSEVGEFCDGRGDYGSGRVAGGESGVVGEGSE